MGSFDEAWKNYFKAPGRFADIVNVYCHGGRQVVKAEDVAEADAVQGKSARDTVRKIVSGQEIIICGIENQERLDPSMAWRVMGYDYEEYKKQVLRIKRENREKFKNHLINKKDVSTGEFLSKFLKTDRLWPVGTIVLYSGGKWTGPRSLWELCGLTQEGAKKMHIVNDYKLHVLEIREMSMDCIEQFVTDIKQVFKVLKLIRNKDKIIKELNSDEAYKTLDPDAKNLIRAYCGNRINKIINREEKVMSSVREDFELMLEDVREETRVEERKKMREEMESARKETESARKEASEQKEIFIKKIVLDSIEEKVSRDILESKLQKIFSLSAKEARDYVKKYGYRSA